MRSWFFSLQFRLVLGFALVLALSLGSVSWYVGYAAQQEADQFQREVEEVGDTDIAQPHGAALRLQATALAGRAGYVLHHALVALEMTGELVHGREDAAIAETGALFKGKVDTGVSVEQGPLAVG